MRFYVHTLGCPKNEVDSAGLTRLLVQAGHQPVDRPEEADLLVANTCGFIAAARQESLDALRELASLKVSSPRAGRRGGPGGRSKAHASAAGSQILIAAGCLGERWGQRLVEEVDGIDAVLGTRRWAEIAQLVERVERGERVCWIGPGTDPLGPASPTRAAIQGQTTLALAGGDTPRTSAYVKIADGCDAGCAFCAIPGIKGPYHSRPLESILDEVAQLAGAGVSEVVLIAQDTTAYGRDLGLRDGLATLLDAIVERVPELPWVRLMYTYPQFITERLLETMARHRQLLKYIDLPLQHAHPDVLKRMNRPHGDPRAVVRQIRSALPDVALRTTFIVGFPGETEGEFRSLLEFMAEARFDRVGVFTYSPEEGTIAGQMAGQVPEQTKRRRYDRAMRRQQGISRELNRQLVGRTLDVLIEAPVEAADGDPSSVPADWVGRSFRDAPEIDGLVFVQGPAAIGRIVSVRVTRAMEYDLVGEIVT